MASDTPFRLYGRMLEYEWALLIAVAFKADQVFRTRRAQLPGQESAVRVVAIRALHQPFVHPVMKRAGELLFLVEMAGVAELWLLVLHQKLAFLGVMRAVAVRATDIVLQMR